MLTDASLPSHYEAICQIADKLEAWSPAMFLGYNSIHFDERLLRQAFYQNLKPAYLTNTNGNSRGDILKLIDAAIVFAPNAIVAPVTDKGRLSRKLDTIAPANGFDHTNAHDALADVEATIYMARLVRTRCPEIWDCLVATASKRSALDQLWGNPALAMVESWYGRHSVRPIAPCGSNPENPAQVVALDLRFDPADLVDLSVEDLLVVMKQRGSPLRVVPANAQPIVAPLEQTNSGLIKDLPSSSVIALRTALIERRADFQERVGEAMALRYPQRLKSPCVEEQIFDSFPHSSDTRLAAQFHNVPWSARRGVLGQIADVRMKELGHRLLALKAPKQLTPEEATRFQAWLHVRRFGPKQASGIRTIEQAIGECDEQMVSAAPSIQGHLKDIRAWLVDQSMARCRL